MKKIVIISLLAIALAAPAGAEFYRYVDEHGNVIYTDDLSRVPEEQRPEATMYEESQTSPDLGTETEKPDPAKATEEGDNLTGERRELEALREKLSQEFKSLADENAKLKSEQKAAVTPDQIKAFNKKVVSYNTRFQAYQEKEAAYKTRLEAFNKRLDDAKPAPAPKE